MTTRATSRAASLTLALLAAACGSDLDEAGARALWDQLQADEYRDPSGPGAYESAPGYETAQPTVRAHGQTARVYLNPVMAAALEETGLSAWPSGSILVKDSFDGDSVRLVAAMEKRAGGWYWAEWDGSGEVKYAGTPDVCINCHTAGEDFVLTVALP